MIEKKRIHLHFSDDTNAQVELDKAFGWNFGERGYERRCRSKWYFVEMTRDTDMKNYNEIKEQESLYYVADQNIIEYKRFDFLKFIELCLFLIFPGIIYIVKKTKQKRRIKANNMKCEEEKKHALERAKILLKGE